MFLSLLKATKNYVTLYKRHLPKMKLSTVLIIILFFQKEPEFRVKTKVVSTTFPLEIYLYGHNVSFRFRNISFIFLRKHVEVKFWTCSFETQFLKSKMRPMS